MSSRNHAPDVMSRDAFDELAQQWRTSSRTAWLAIVLALLSFAYGISLLVVVFLHMR